MEFNERLDKIWGRISDEDFLANRGVANEVRYYVFDYEPCDELIIRDKIKSLKKQNNPDADGFQIVEYDLYDMVIGILEEKGYIDKCIKFEEQKGMEYLYTAVTKMLRLTNDDNLIVNRILENTPNNAVVFLTGVGKCYPLLQATEILNKVLYNMPASYNKVPMVLFYPGTYTDQELILFNKVHEDNYYRAFRIVRD